MIAIKQWLATDMRLSTTTIRLLLSLLFLLSGCAALMYQVLWERMLFTLLGVDLESITIIISVFMFGLGIGALSGGKIADRFPTHLLLFYIIIEITVGCFGLVSPALITSMGQLLPNSEWITALMSFTILALPTLLMGATFPILVTHVSQFDRNIGHVVGSLYFANTMGGALGAYFSGFILLYITDVVGAIDCAAQLNFCVAAMAFFIFKRQ